MTGLKYVRNVIDPGIVSMIFVGGTGHEGSSRHTAFGTSKVSCHSGWVRVLSARIDAQREKLAGQLGELEATERVLARYSTGTKRTVSAKSPPSPTKAVAPAQRQRGRRPATTAKRGDGRRTSATLSDQVLALATGRTQQEITAACKGARPNHVGAAISRHKRAGRIEERDGKLYASQATEAAQHAAV